MPSVVLDREPHGQAGRGARVANPLVGGRGALEYAPWLTQWLTVRCSSTQSFLALSHPICRGILKLGSLQSPARRRRPALTHALGDVRMLGGRPGCG